MTSDAETFEQLTAARPRILAELGKAIVGQHEVIEQILIALFAGGHCLITGAPGLAKTLLVKSIAQIFHLEFRRIQFTPDLMPTDITGVEILKEGADGRELVFMPGPIFGNMLLADEINRTPPKTQAALLEAMQEKSVTIGGHTLKLDQPFFVLATQNPIEQEGTYPLPEAQLDRFLMHVRIDYPDGASEAAILKFARNRARETLRETVLPQRCVSQAQIFAARAEVLSLHLAPALEEYIVQFVLATRTPKVYGEDLSRWIAYGASPRGTIALDRCARAHAWLAGRDFVAPEDVHAVAADVLRHRVLLTYEAEAEGVTSDRVISALLDRVPLP